ncbi:MAG: hypothetical protein WKF75_01800 [Singulisphaera sp.]
MNARLRRPISSSSPSLENCRGARRHDSFSFSTTTGIRTQLVFDASLFAVSTPQRITAIQFRPIDPAGGISAPR